MFWWGPRVAQCYTLQMLEACAQVRSTQGTIFVHEVRNSLHDELNVDKAHYMIKAHCIEPQAFNHILAPTTVQDHERCLCHVRLDPARCHLSCPAHRYLKTYMRTHVRYFLKGRRWGSKTRTTTSILVTTGGSGNHMDDDCLDTLYRLRQVATV